VGSQRVRSPEGESRDLSGRRGYDRLCAEGEDRTVCRGTHGAARARNHYARREDRQRRGREDFRVGSRIRVADQDRRNGGKRTLMKTPGNGSPRELLRKAELHAVSA